MYHRDIKKENEYVGRHITFSYVNQNISKLWEFHMDQQFKFKFFTFARNVDQSALASVLSMKNREGDVRISSRLEK